MMQRRPLAGLVAAAGLAAATVLAGCGSSPTGSGTAPTAGSTVSGAATAAGFPVSVTSALGTATIPKAPQRVVALGWGSNDAALALGVVPVGMSSQIPETGGVSPWAKARLDGQQPEIIDDAGGAVPFEKIAALHPDLILGVYSGLTAEQYGKLSAIAPTVAYPKKPWATGWQDQLSIVGKALGRSAQATTLATQVRQQISAAAAAHPEFKGRTIMFGSGTKPGGYNLYLADDPRMQLLGQLGFSVSDAATTTFTHGPDSPDFATSISLEQLPKLRTDLLVAWYLSPQTQSGIESQSVFRSLTAVKDKAYVPITDPALVFATSAPNVLSIPWMLTTYVPELSTAAKASKAAGA